MSEDDICLNVDQNYMKKKSDNEFQENQEKFMMSQYPELRGLMGEQKTNLAMMLNEDEADENIDLEVLDPVQIKFEGSTAKGMRGTIIIKKRAIKDKKFLQWISNRELYQAWEHEHKKILVTEKDRKKKIAKRKKTKQRALEEEKELNTCDIANDLESPDMSVENLKQVK